MHLNIVAEPTGLDRTGLHVDLDVCSWLKYFHFHCFFGVLFSFHSINSIFITTRVRRPPPRRRHVDVMSMSISWQTLATTPTYVELLFSYIIYRFRAEMSKMPKKKKVFFIQQQLSQPTSYWAASQQDGKADLTRPDPAPAPARLNGRVSSLPRWSVSVWLWRVFELLDKFRRLNKETETEWEKERERDAAHILQLLV